MTGPSNLWNARTPRERWFIGALGLALVGTLYWYGLWQPVNRLGDKSSMWLSMAHTAQSRADEEDRRLAQFKPSAIRGLDEDIKASAAAQGIRLAPGSDRGHSGGVAVRIEGVQPDAFFQWTRQLTEKAIFVADMTATNAGGGRIDVDATLSR